MYNFKEKKLHFNALRNPDAAIYDLELLRKGCPWLPQLRTYARDPKRYADEILYSLLDHTTRENIRAFRRQKLDELKAVAEVPGSETPSANAITATDNDTTATDETAGTGGETPPVSETTTDNGIPATNEATSTDTTNSPASEKIEELEQSLEEAEERADEAEQRAEEAEEAQEEAETRAEKAEQALETEKKKEQPVAAPAKSKSTRSTRKSTGTTSSTRKSK